MTDVAAPAQPRYDRSIVEGPLQQAVWKIAWPTMLTNAIGGLQGMVDHVLVGNLVGYKANAAIGVSWQIFLVVIVFISSLFTGMSVLVARLAGAGEPEKVDRVVYQAFLTAIGLALGILAPVGYLVTPWLLDLVNAAPAVKAEALPYLRIMFGFSSGMMIFFMLGGALRSAGDARTPMILGIVMTVVNLLLNIVLIRELFRFGLPTGIQGIAMNIGGVLMLSFIGSLAQSAAAQAAFAVSYTELFSLITWTSVGLMGSAAAVAGQNLGAGHPDRANEAVHIAARYGLSVAACVGLFFLFLPRQLLAVFGMHDAVVVDVGVQLLRVLSVSGLFITVALAFTGGMQGTGDTKSPL